MISRFVLRLLIDEHAQGLVDYSLIISLISIAVVAFVLVFQGALSELYEFINSKIELINK